MNWRDDMPVSLDVFVILAFMANLGAYLLSGGSLWLSLIPVGLAGAMLLPMSVLNVLAKRSPRAVVLSIVLPVLALGPAMFIALLLRHS